MLEHIKKKQQLKIGFAPAQRAVFDKKEALKYKRIVEDRVKAYGVRMENLEWLNEDGLLNNGADADKVAKRFMEKDVDAVFFPHCDFGAEDAVARVARRVNRPVLIWGPRDDAPEPDGSRLRDSQCGIFATTKVLNLYGVPFTYITNSRIEDEVFDRGFKNFLSAASIVKAFRNMRIGQISTRPGTFWSVIVNEGELLERFGIEVVPTTLVDIEKATRSILAGNAGELRTAVREIREKIRDVRIDDEGVNKIAALKLAIRRWAEDENLSAIGIQCWSALQAALGVLPCFINGELTDEGLPVVCETDIYGAVTAVMAQAAKRGGEPVFFADLTVRHPENPNAELLWHCGNFPYSLARDKNAASLTELSGAPYPAVGNWEIRGGDITVCRFGGANGRYSLLMGHGKGVEGPYNRGTYIWVEFNDWPLWEHKFVYGPYIHHCAGIHGKLAPALYEACRYIPGLTPDPVDPTEEQILKYLRG